jgi:hypothetical protein
MIFAQSLGEYGAASGVASQLAQNVDSAVQWVQVSWSENRPIWIAAAICVVIGFWLFRRT